MNPERENRSHFTGCYTLVRMAEQRKAHVVVFGEPAAEKLTATKLLAFYPALPGVRESYRLYQYGGGSYSPPFLDSVLNLALPQGIIEDLGIKDEPTKRKITERLIAPYDVPSILLAAGKTPDEGEEFLLYFLPGISPQTALKELQLAVRIILFGIAQNN